MTEHQASERDPLDIVAAKYSPPHWVWLREVRNNTGFQSNRSADALAIGLYHSRGQFLVGFEQKVSRSDWLNELKQPDKAESIAQFCDYWNLVIPDREIIQEAEIPPLWGVLLAFGRRVQVVKQAPKMKARPIDRGLLASLIQRSVAAAVAPHLISDKEKLNRAEAEGFERGKLMGARELEDLRRLQEQIHDFEEASGITMSKWASGKAIGAAVKVVLEAPRTGSLGYLSADATRIAGNLEDTARKLRECVAVLQGAHLEVPK